MCGVGRDFYLLTVPTKRKLRSRAIILARPSVSIRGCQLPVSLDAPLALKDAALRQSIYLGRDIDISTYQTKQKPQPSAIILARPSESVRGYQLSLEGLLALRDAALRQSIYLCGEMDTSTYRTKRKLYPRVIILARPWVSVRGCQLPVFMEGPLTPRDAAFQSTYLGREIDIYIPKQSAHVSVNGLELATI